MSSVSIYKRIDNLSFPLKATPPLIGAGLTTVGALGLLSISIFGKLTLIGSSLFVGIGGSAFIGSLVLFTIASVKKNERNLLDIPDQTVLSIKEASAIFKEKATLEKPFFLSFATGCTYIPEEDGILDFTGKLGEFGAYLSDGSGKDNQASRLKLAGLWKKMEETFSSAIEKHKTLESLGEFIEGYLVGLSSSLEKERVGSTISGAILFSIQKQKFALFFNVGDNMLLHSSKKTGNSIFLIPQNDPSLKSELSFSPKSFIGIVKVENWDKIFGLSDGVYKNRDDLITFLHSNDNASALIKDLEENNTKKDDVGIFILVV